VIAPGGQLLQAADSGFPGPCFRHGAAPGQVIHHQDELEVVIAVADFDVDAGVGHAARELSKLTRNRLLQALDHHVALPEHADTRRFRWRRGHFPCTSCWASVRVLQPE
jgi:hypothetical protein